MPLTSLLRTALPSLAVLLAVVGSPLAMAAEAKVGSPPWLISNGQPDAGLYVPRDVQQAYAKGTRSPDGKPGPNYWQNHA
jgi:hypothetical protein